MWASLDGQGKLTGKPMPLPLAAEGAASSVAIESVSGKLRAVIARTPLDALALDAIDLSSSTQRAYPLLVLDGPPSLDVALVLHGGVAFFNDDGPSTQDKRARRD